MANLQDYYRALEELVPGSHPIGQVEQLNAINSALALHAKHRPRQIVEDVAGTGGFDYALSGFASWADGFSRIVQVEYPVDDTSPDASVLEEEDWTIYKKPAGDVLRFLDATPETDETIRVTYTARHMFDDDDVCSVAEADDSAVQKLAAALYCRILAAAYAQDDDSTIQADSVDHSSKRREYEAQAGKYRSEYDEHMGLGKTKEGSLKAACATQDWDMQSPSGWDWVTHPNRRR
jgi:hypothetical protein